MRKQILIIITLMLSWLNVMAENDLTSYIFVDKEGKEVQDGAKIKLTDVTEDLFGSMIESGLSVKNVAGAANTTIRIHYIISKISGGSFQICFPTNCVSKSAVGEFYTTEGTMSAGEVRDLMAELVLDGDGECLVSVQIEQVTVVGSGLNKITSVSAYGPKVTLGFNCDAEGNDPETETEEFWWGYYDGGETGGLGVNTADTYFAASHFLANNSMTNGSTIHAVRFHLGNGANISGVSVWISKTLPSTVANADYVQSVPNRTLPSVFKDGTIELELDTPYKVDGDVYVGYTFTVKTVSTDADKYPIIVSRNCYDNEGLYLKTTNSVTQWYGPAGEEYGALALELQITNTNLITNAVELVSVGNGIGVLGDTKGVPVNVKLNSIGVNGVSSLGYVVTLNGEEGPEQTLDLGETVSLPGRTWNWDLIVLPANKTGYSDMKIRLTKVNGVNNPVENNVATGSFITVAQYSERKVAVEEFTGTWCGWCPRGMVAMNRFEETYGDRFVGIAVHNEDPMECSDYNPIVALVDGFPDMFINRTLEIDPYYGTYGQSITEFQPSLQDVEDALAMPTEASVRIYPKWNQDSTAISARVETTFQYDRSNAPYALAFVLTEDDMKGTGSRWNQSNYFYQYKLSASQFSDTELLKFVNGSSSMSGLTFNHVAVGAWNIKNGRSGSISAPLVAGEVQTYNFSANIESNDLIQDKKQLRLAVLLINTQTGEIVNADKADIVSETTGISGHTLTLSEGEGAVFDLQGRRVGQWSAVNGQLPRGIYIVNGKKVVIK